MPEAARLVENGDRKLVITIREEMKMPLSETAPGQMPHDAVTRIRPAADCELRIAPTAGGVELTGQFLYNALSSPIDGVRERILPKAFAASIADPDSDIRLDVDHETDKLLARTGNRSLRLFDGRQGLRFEATLLAGSPLHQHVLAAVRARLIDALSPAWRRRGVVARFVNENGETIREVVQARLLGLAVTATPAYGRSTTLSAASPAMPPVRCSPDERDPRRLRQALCEAITRDDDQRAARGKCTY